MLYFVTPDWWRPRTAVITRPEVQEQFQAIRTGTTSMSERASRASRGLPDRPSPGRRPYYLITEEARPAPLGSLMGWMMQLDGDAHRNAFLNSPWVKAVLPIRPSREREAMIFLERPEAAYTVGLDELYPYEEGRDTKDYKGLKLRDVLLLIADKIKEEYDDSLEPVNVDKFAVNPKVALPTETVFSGGYGPLDKCISVEKDGKPFGDKAFEVLSEWLEVLSTDQVVATEYSLQGLG